MEALWVILMVGIVYGGIIFMAGYDEPEYTEEEYHHD